MTNRIYDQLISPIEKNVRKFIERRFEKKAEYILQLKRQMGVYDKKTQ